MPTTYTVKTRDVDGGSTREFKTLAGARKRFEEMAGHTMEAAIAEQFHDRAEPPKAEEVKALRTVSMFGTVVTFAARQCVALKVGGRYKARDGRVIKIVSPNSARGPYKFWGDDGYGYTPDGRYSVSCQTDADLVEEVA